MTVQEIAAKLDELQQQAEATPRAAAANRRWSMRLSKILAMPEIFQHRSRVDEDDDGTVVPHVTELVRAIKASGGKPLAPVVVWWTGKGWVCIDGHHRMAAYREAFGGTTGDDGKPADPVIPVEGFAGTADEAYAKALAGNTRDKLPMTRDQKSNAAWRMVCMEGRWSKSQTATASGVGLRTVGYMRTTYERLRKVHEDAPERCPHPADIETWREASLKLDGSPEGWDENGDDSAKRRAAERVRDVLIKGLGIRQPPTGRLGADVFALAVELWDPALAVELRNHLPVPEADDNSDF